MKILVTGGLGFIGSNFILFLKQKYPDYSIVNIDAKLFGSNLKNLTSIENSSNYEFVSGNIVEKNSIEKYLENIEVNKTKVA